MTQFTVHTLETAPEASRSLVEGAKKAFGFIPNLIGVFAESPAALEGYLSVAAAFEKSSLTPTEKQVVLIATSVDNACEYCVAAHTTVGNLQKIPSSTLDAVRDGRPIGDARLEALRNLTVSIVHNRGFADAGAIEAFYAAGYTKENLLEVLTGITQKTLSNYVNHIAATPLDRQFEKAAWSREGAVA